jgi:hypothetical protein
LVSLRVCNRCKRELPISEFYNPPSGMRYSCKKCDYEYSRTYFKIIQNSGLNMRRNTDERTPEEGGQALVWQAIEEEDTELN